ncbi:MAG: MobF family relaxase [Cyanobacteria bacterium P01_D01_bin.105]
MMTVSKVSAGHAGHYYTADMPGQSQLDSQWMGKAANELGVSGPVDPALFKCVIAGKTPNGKPLAQRQGISRRAGIDITFLAPKSVSVEALHHQNSIVLAAHRQAVAVTLSGIEQQAQTRQMRQGKVKFLTTGNLVAAAFEHTLNRHNDPQLHTHVVIINVTRYQGQWRSFYARKLFQQIKRWGKFYRDKLATLIIEAGHQLRATAEGFWEMASIPAAVIKLFSKRRSEILEKVGDNASTVQKQYACLTTRPDKKPLPLAQLRKQWAHQIRIVTARQREQAMTETQSPDLTR